MQFQGRDLGRGVAALSLQQRQCSDINMSRSRTTPGETVRSADHHGGEDDAVAFNEDGERWCNLSSIKGTLLRRLLSG